MIIRRVLEELEARLESPGGAAKGKLEFKRYGDGTLHMKIKCRGLDLPDGAALVLRAGNALIARLAVRDGRAVLDEERPESKGAPLLAAGDGVTLYEGDKPVMSGVLYED